MRLRLSKNLLCSAPVLAAPNNSLPYKLDVDASAVGAGAVLLQEAGRMASIILFVIFHASSISIN